MDVAVSSFSPFFTGRRCRQADEGRSSEINASS
ncbi:hypothetical protein C7477_10225 [Phyllobacterium leguminum]|uniref:Uncharacterized protein n=1 Tax=Phyllobacterium leguminum TaxID=314237 RepID=A0A318T4Q6_9HYPH|nr:hypothetical protein C7477_10225 [Phyllobacterium leguminum]